jgi:hypothetical protein
MFWTRSSSVVGGPLLVAGLLAAGLRYDLFHRLAYYDLFMHTLGGIVVAASTAGLAWRMQTARGAVPGSFGTLTVMPFLVVLLVSILWEAVEVLLGMTPNWTQSVGDTLSDLIYALAGAVLMLCFIRLEIRHIQNR